MTCHIYLLKLTDRGMANAPNHDYVDGFVIAAESETVARIFAAKNSRDEGPLAWTVAAQSSCILLGRTHPRRGARVLLRSFNAG